MTWNQLNILVIGIKVKGFISLTGFKNCLHKLLSLGSIVCQFKPRKVSLVGTSTLLPISKVSNPPCFCSKRSSFFSFHKYESLPLDSIGFAEVELCFFAVRRSDITLVCFLLRLNELFFFRYSNLGS
jgi:hypothetical protein